MEQINKRKQRVNSLKHNNLWTINNFYINFHYVIFCCTKF